jgi:hypothetical protein
MTDMSERHEVRVRAGDSTIVFTADSEDGRLCIRQEPDGGKPGDACSIALSDPQELAAFFTGLRRMLSSLGQDGSPRVEQRPDQKPDNKARRAVRRSRERPAG